MKTKTYHITIPKPCMENWDQMAPAGKGRHCLHCQKNVIDFTMMSNEEIIKVINTGSNLCGHFKVNQLKQPLIEPVYVQPKLAWRKAVFIAVLSLFSFRTISFSQEKQIAKTEQVFDKNAEPDYPQSKESGTDTNKVTIKGMVLDSATKEPVKGAVVSLKENGIVFLKLATDSNGEFSFSYAAEKMENLSLSCSHMGYTEQILPLKVYDTCLEILLIENLEIKASKTELLIVGSISTTTTTGDVIQEKPVFNWYK